MQPAALQIHLHLQLPAQANIGACVQGTSKYGKMLLHTWNSILNPISHTRDVPGTHPAASIQAVARSFHNSCSIAAQGRSWPASASSIARDQSVPVRSRWHLHDCVCVCSCQCMQQCLHAAQPGSSHSPNADPDWAYISAQFTSFT